MPNDTKSRPGQRGPAEHKMRERVIASAHVLFSSKGFAATSVAEIAANLQVAPTYLYKFFQSKTAIGEAVCTSMLSAVDDALWQVARGELRPMDKVANLFRVILKESVGMFFAERKLHDMVARALEEEWPAVATHRQQIREVIAHILEEGMQAGAFDPQLDRAETVEALFWALFPFCHPRVLEQSIHMDLDARARIMGRFCARALARRNDDVVTN